MTALRMVAGVGLAVLYASAWLTLALGMAYASPVEDAL